MPMPWKNEEAALVKALPAYVAARRWFRSKSSGAGEVRIVDTLPLTDRCAIAILEIAPEVASKGAGPDRRELYTLPLSAMDGEVSEALAILRLKSGAILCDALADPQALSAILQGFAAGLEIRGERSTLSWGTVRVPFDAGAPGALSPHPLGVEQSNSSILYGGRYMLKLLRLLDAGESADLEMSRFLGAAGYANAPRLEGSIRWSPDGGTAATLAILQAFVPNQGGAWERTLERLNQLLTEHPEPPGPSAAAVLAPHVARARLLGQRTAELHRALGRATGDPAFDPEPLTQADQQALAESASGMLDRGLSLLRERSAKGAHPSWPLWAGEIVGRLRAFGQTAVGGMRTRVHGDLHLGQVLEGGDDVMLIDFEGEPARPLSERRAKRSPLVDVAGMLRSFHYAATTALRGPDSRPWASAWMNAWHRAVGDGFRAEYFERLAGTTLLPSDRAGRDRALDFFLLEKCLYELLYELDNRPDWVAVPLAGLKQLVQPDPKT
jgi:trehalose synthase-fused probable maltokinase